ncbi:ubiquitin carboxyl-terminal hydrolase [Chironomus tepperi]|uniref:ubiquitin carboxyl-terminal hydrolase n=1 Tax=Chironomus tepperi TaxID=113505 RepID=UPI00391F1035
MSESFVVPLESNPDVLNKFMKSIGVPDKYQLFDVYGLEEDTLAFLNKPVLAFILLFPCTENYENHRKQQDEEMKANPPKTPENLFYMKQYLHNACGTVALFHSILNNLDRITLEDGPLKSFYEKAKDLSPEERGKLLETDEGIISIHQKIAQEGQTEAPPANSDVLFHYVALTKVGDELFELDGGKCGAVSHGSTSDETFLTDAAIVCKKFMSRDEKELRFSFMAIAAAEN